MAIPPSFSDLNKSVKDIFNKGYNFGLYKLDFKTKAHNGVEFNVAGTQRTDSGATAGSLESKYTVKEHGLTISEKWGTDNNIRLEIGLEPKTLPGSKVTLVSNYSPQSGKKSALLKTIYKRANVYTTTDIDLDAAGPLVHTSLVAAREGVRTGVQASFSSGKSEITRHSVALGWKNGPYSMFAAMHNFSDYEAGVHKSVAPNFECGIKAAWSQKAASNAETNLGVAVKYQVDSDTAVRAKIDNKSLLCLSYSQRVRPGVTWVASAAVDTPRFNQGGHKLGWGLEVEA